LILVDANLLVYARVRSLPQHEAARAWLDARINDTPRVGLPWASLLAFVRLTSSRRVFERPERVTEAWRQVERWLGADSVWVPTPTERHARVLGGLLDHVGERAELVPDAHLAALAIEHGLELCSTDGDFGRFPGLRWKNPLEAGAT
jgi:toxin-antitoxin system PIN domain toxin